MTANIVLGTAKQTVTLVSVNRNQNFGLTLNLTAPLAPDLVVGTGYELDIFDDTGVQIETETGWVYQSKSYTLVENAGIVSTQNYQLIFGR